MLFCLFVHSPPTTGHKHIAINLPPLENVLIQQVAAKHTRLVGKQDYSDHRLDVVVFTHLRDVGFS